MQQPDYAAFFRRYAQAYEQSLAGPVQVELIRSFFAPTFMSLATGGGLACGNNDDSFVATLEQGYAYYRAIGTTGLDVAAVDTQEIAENHDRVAVSYVARYRRPSDGQDVAIPFSLVYLLQRQQAGPVIFAFIAGDEMDLYRQHGLVDAEGKPIGR